MISNAIKFRGDELPIVQIGAEQITGFWLFSICDNGIGIDEQYRERIFDIFQRLHAREEYEGTGIGLAVAKRIVERHGGEFKVSESPLGGTCFKFTLRTAAFNNQETEEA